MQLDMSARCRKSEKVISRNVAGEVLLLPVQKEQSMDSLYTLDEIGAYIWNSLDGERTLGDVRDLLVAEYEVTPEVAENDLLDFIRQLELAGAVERA